MKWINMMMPEGVQIDIRTLHGVLKALTEWRR